MWYFASGDSGFYFQEQLKNISWLPRIWNPEYGFGISTLLRMWFDYPYLLFIKLLSSIGLSWWQIDKLVWLLLFGMMIVSVIKLSHVLSFSKISSVVACIIYCTNTYVLLLFGGGQIGVALAYGLSPFVLGRFIESYIGNGRKISMYIQNGLWLSLLVAFDLRIAYLTVLACILYTLIHNWRDIYKKIEGFIVPLGITVCIHAFWILPAAIFGGDRSINLSGEYTGPGMLKFLSFADFSHTLTLLHPNWPENLFGKVYFLQPEFLVIPFLAFVSLVCIRQTKNKKYILYFALLSLIGAFFAKGVNPPGGGLFQWLFLYIPGFMMFRDPTKFYLFIALGFATLIPYSLENLCGKVKKREWTFLIIFVLFWCFTIRSVFLGRVAGNFKPLELHADYQKFKDVLIHDTTPSRSLWMPTIEKFAYSSLVHPELAATDLFKNASLSGLMAVIDQPEFQADIHDAGVKYIIVPIDVEKRMFLSDYTYDDTKRNALIASLKERGYLQDKTFTDLAVFINPSYIFVASKPESVVKQEYWLQIGIGISILAILFFGLLSILYDRRKHE